MKSFLRILCALLWASFAVAQPNAIKVQQLNAAGTSWQDRIFPPASGGVFQTRAGFNTALGLGTSDAAQFGTITAVGSPQLTPVPTIAALKAVVVTSLTTNTSVATLGYYTPGDAGGGTFYYSSSSSATDNGGTVIQPTAGSGRWLRNYSGPLNVRWFGAKGNGSTDDTTAIQNCAALACATHATLYIPSAGVSQYYKITAPITFTSQLSIVGDDPTGSVIIGVGLSAGQYTFDFNLASAPNYFWSIENICIRSLDHVPNGIRLKNVSYVTLRNVWLYGCYDGLSIQGTQCFSNEFDNVVSYTSVHHGVEFAPSFSGGGQYTFTHCTFDGDTGFYVDDTAAVFGLSLRECNFESCVTNCAYVGGSVQGLSFYGPRTEANAGATDFNINPAMGNVVAGLVIDGGAFTANSAATVAISLGGNGGSVRGFMISGNYASNSSSSYFVKLNGEGESGSITGNKFLQSATTPADSQRAGVVVFSNENASGKCAEYWGTSAWGVIEYNWTPTDQSGASLSFVTAAGYATKIGRVVHWQAVVVYPVTANGSTAIIGGLPSNPTVGGSTQGRAGGHVDLTDAGIDLGLYQGFPNTNKVQIVNRQSLVNITNAQLSGKTLYFSGQYTL